MKQNVKKKGTVLLLAVLSLSLVVGSWAFYNHTATINNTLETGVTSSVAWERFDSPPNFEPGDEIAKEVFVKNTGDTNLVVRVSMQEMWKLSGGVSTQTIASSDADFNIPSADSGDQLNAADGLTAGDGTVVFKNINLTDWTFNAGDGYWYYNSVLLPAGTPGDLDATEVLLKSVTLAKNADMGINSSRYYYTSLPVMPDFPPADVTGDHTTGWELYATDDDTVPVPPEAKFSFVDTALDLNTPGYADAGYVLSIKIETLQATSAALDEVWGSNSVLDALRATWGI